MSFGYSLSDGVLLCQLAWNTVQNSRKACGEHDELTREVSALHVVLQRLQQEVDKPESPINKPEDTCRDELQINAAHCGQVLRLLDKILAKYNALGEHERRGRKLLQRIRFGNGEMANLGDLRSKIVLYTTTITFYLNMASLGTVGRVEQQMNNAGGILKEIQLAVNGITTQFISRSDCEESIFTTYANDDKGVWREFRRELVHEGFSSPTIHKHKRLILEYVRELGSRGLLDDQDASDACCNLDVEDGADAVPPKATATPFISRLQNQSLPVGGIDSSRGKQLKSELKANKGIEPKWKPKDSNPELDVLMVENWLPDARAAALSDPLLQSDQLKDPGKLRQAYAETVPESASDGALSDNINDLRDEDSIGRGTENCKEDDLGTQSLDDEPLLRDIFQSARSRQCMVNTGRYPSKEQSVDKSSALRNGFWAEDSGNSEGASSAGGETESSKEWVAPALSPRMVPSKNLATKATFIVDSEGQITCANQSKPPEAPDIHDIYSTWRSECETFLKAMAVGSLDGKRPEDFLRTYDILRKGLTDLIDLVVDDNAENGEYLLVPETQEVLDEELPLLWETRHLLKSIEWATDLGSPFNQLHGIWHEFHEIRLPRLLSRLRSTETGSKMYLQAISKDFADASSDLRRRWKSIKTGRIYEFEDLKSKILTKISSIRKLLREFLDSSQTDELISPLWSRVYRESGLSSYGYMLSGDPWDATSVTFREPCEYCFPHDYRYRAQSRSSSVDVEAGGVIDD